MIAFLKGALAGKTAVREDDLAPYAEILYGDATIPSLPVNQAREIAQAA